MTLLDAGTLSASILGRLTVSFERKSLHENQRQTCTLIVIYQLTPDALSGIATKKEIKLRKLEWRVVISDHLQMASPDSIWNTNADPLSTDCNQLLIVNGTLTNEARHSRTTDTIDDLSHHGPDLTALGLLVVADWRACQLGRHKAGSPVGNAAIHTPRDLGHQLSYLGRFQPLRRRA